ncbi:Fc.00g071860.m01.CDS01 [Cosmosporella sp. VM-42]
MERDNKTLATRPNGRPSSLIVKEQGRRPLFTGRSSLQDGKDKENGRAQPNTGRFRTGNTTDSLRRSNSESFEERRGSGSSLASPGGTRIPKPTGASFSNRKPISLRDALKRAEMEEGEETDHSHVMDASPSPAPRLARARRDEDEKKMRKIFSQDHLDSKAPARPFSRDSIASGVLSASPEKNETPRRRTLYGKPRAGLGSTPKDPVKTNGIRSEEPLEDMDDRLRTGPGWLRPMGSKDSLTREGRIPALVPGIEDLPLPSIENGERANHFRNASPEKSFAWQVDEDFTAGDLQVSDSPRIRMGTRPFANRLNFDEGSEVDISLRTRLANPGSRNTKLDDILTTEIKTDKNPPPEPYRPTRQPNTKLPAIAAREEEVERQIPIPDRNLPRPKNTKLPGIQQAEIDGLSKRALATTRLGEIRERNSEPRSLSPEISKPQTSRSVREPKPGSDQEAKELVRPKSAFEPREGERIPDTPVTIYKSRQAKSIETNEEDKETQSGKDGPVTRPGLSHKRDDSRDLLRRLGRAVSSSPQPETDSRRPPSPPKSTKTQAESSVSRSGIPRRTSDDGKKTSRNETKEPEHSKPTVGFVGLPRTRSSDSVKSKRSSMHSETDPTDRIEAEMNLFAPAENHSEKGSIRAPSPSPGEQDEDEADFDATPKPKRIDPLTMPTPKAPGAYVETPATVKVERPEAKQEGDLRDDKPTRPLIQDKKMDLAWRSRDKDTASDPGTDEKPVTIAESSGVRRRRARSLPRRRGPLVNTAKLPSVKDDLMELQRSHNIEDSTLDDFEEVLKGRRTASPRLAALLKDIPTKPATDGDDDSYDLDLDLDLDLDTKLNTKTNEANITKDEKYHSDSDINTSDRMRRMSKTLETGLLGIRTVKRGIERLEDQVSHAENKQVEMMDTLPPKHDPCIACTTHPDLTTTSYIHLPMPHLYHHTPTFRLTLLGMALLLLSAWYAAESAMCALYCRPTTCSSTPCVWSINDPTFGNALPIKLDQWTTHGHGRAFMDSALEQAKDWAADVKDVYHGRDITDINTAALTFEQKRQHRRRLQKKGLLQSKAEPRDQKAKWDAWHQARVAKERAREAREMGYEVRDEEETIGGDERVWP